MRVYRYTIFIALIVVSAALLLWACTTAGSAAGRKAPDRELPQYSQKG